MTESIGKQLATLCAEILPFYLSEAESKSYPYAVYEQTTQEFRTKDGVYKITAESTIRVYSNDSATANAKADAIRTAVDGNTDSKYIFRFLRRTKDCLEGVWNVELVYYVKQTS